MIVRGESTIIDYHAPFDQGLYYSFIIQHIVTLPKYGHDALDIRNRYPAVYVASYVGKKSEVRKCRQRDLQGFRLFCYQFVE